MDNTILDMAVNLMPLMNYLYRRGIFSIHAWPDDEKHESVHLTAKLFMECFPDVIPSEENDWYVNAEYKGVKFTAYFSKYEREELLS